MSAWARMDKVIDRYERITIEQVREMKDLQKKIIASPGKESVEWRRMKGQIEDQLLSGLQSILAMRGDVDSDSQHLFDNRIEPIRKQIQTAVNMNNNLPALKDSTFVEETIEDSMNPYEMETKRYAEATDVRVLQAKAMAEDAKAKAEAMAKLNKDIQDIEVIFAELATLVHEQHDMVDSIEEHVERATLDVNRGNEQLKKAVASQTAKAPILVGVVGGLALGGPVGVAAGSAIAGVAAGVTGLVAGIYGGRWFKNAVKKDCGVEN